MKRTKLMPLALFVAIAMLGLASCGNKAKAPDEESQQGGDSAMTEGAASNDSTIYGTSGEFGMSTFTLITTDGDTLNVMRDGSDGSEAQIAGDLNEGQKYAMTTRDGGESLSRLVNVTQLEKHTKDFEISNGMVVLTSPQGEPDTVSITRLDDEVLLAKGKHGDYNFK